MTLRRPELSRSSGVPLATGLRRVVRLAQACEVAVLVRATEVMGDHVVDMGPLAGSKGGEIVYEGDYKGLLKSGTLTGDHMLKYQPIKTALRKPKGVQRNQRPCDSAHSFSDA